MTSDHTVTKHRLGPILQMNTRSPALFWGGDEAEGAWVPYGDPRIQLYDAALALEGEPAGPGIYVDVLNQAPDFPRLPDMQYAEESFRVNYDFTAPHADELVWNMFSGEPSRLVGMHIDEHDYYYRLRRFDGTDVFASMVYKLDPLRSDWPPEEYAREDAEFTANGVGPVGEFLVTREIDMLRERVEVFGRCVLVRFFTKDDWVLFGPFEDRPAYEAFYEKAARVGTLGYAFGWRDEYRNDPRFCGLEIPDGLEDRHSEEISEDDQFGLVFWDLECDFSGSA